MGPILIVCAIGAAIQGGGVTLIGGFLAYQMLRQVTSTISDVEARLCLWSVVIIATGAGYWFLIRSLPFDDVLRTTGGSPERFFEGIIKVAFWVPAGPGLGSLLIAFAVWFPFRIIRNILP